MQSAKMLHFCILDGRWPRERDSAVFCTAPWSRATASATGADGSGYRVAIRGAVIEILMIAQLQDSATVDWSARLGVGARAKFTSAEIGFELSYDGRSKEFQPGGAAEWRVVPGVWLIGG